MLNKISYKRKFWKDQALAESFWILLPHFLAIKQFDGSIIEIIFVILKIGQILSQAHLQHNTTTTQ